MSTESTTRKDLKPVKTKLRLKKADVRQCRLCMRVLPRTDMRDAPAFGSDLRRKILDAVSVKITTSDKVTSVCVNCVALIDIIYNFRVSCRKADTLHGTKLLMMHPGSWLSEENKFTLEECHRLIKRNRAEMDALFKVSGLDNGDVSMLIEKNAQEVILESKDKPTVKTEEVSDSDPEMSEQCGKRLDEEVQNASVIGRLGQKWLRKKLPPTKNKEEMCEICGELIPVAKLEEHTNRHTDHRPYRCPEEGCEKAYYSRMTRNVHIRMSHSEKELRWHSCTLCGQKARGIARLRKHMNTHKQSNPQKGPCPMCGKRVYKSYMKDHLATHTGELQYGCEFCGRRFAAKQNISHHRKKYHSDKLAELAQENELVGNGAADGAATDFGVIEPTDLFNALN